MPLLPRDQLVVGMQPFSRAFVIEENRDFLDRVDAIDLNKVLPIRKKVVILSQEPSPGGDVPRGTVVNLTLAVKDDLPMDILGVEPILAQKWANPALLEAAVTTAPNAARLEKILVEKSDISELTDDDRAAFGTFAAEHGIADADQAKVFKDVKLAFTL